MGISSQVSSCCFLVFSPKGLLTALLNKRHLSVAVFKLRILSSEVCRDLLGCKAVFLFLLCCPYISSFAHEDAVLVTALSGSNAMDGIHGNLTVWGE